MSSQQFISGIARSIRRRSWIDIVVITIRSAQVVKSPKFAPFRVLIAPKPYILHQNACTKGTLLGCRLAPEMIPITNNCAALSQTPYPRVPYFGLFFTARTMLPLQALY